MTVPDYRLDDDYIMVAEGDLVYATMSGTMKGPMKNREEEVMLEPTNRAGSQKTFSMYRIEDGKIVEYWLLFDLGAWRKWFVTEDAKTG